MKAILAAAAIALCMTTGAMAQACHPEGCTGGGGGGNGGGDGGVPVPTSGVPEPATWGLMILGFAAVGYRMKSRIKIEA